MSGSYPYEVVQSPEDLNRSTLPPITDFYSTLGVGNDLSLEDYLVAQDVWDVFECQTLGDYTQVYVELDVILLSEVFSNFKDNCKSKFDLYPDYYMTLPG